MNINSILLVSALATFVTYFYLFQRHIKSLGPEQRQDFVKRSRPGRWVNLLTVVPLGILLAVENIYIRSGAALAMLAFMIVGEKIQHQSLRELKFSEEFITKLRRLSCLAGLTVVLVFCFLLLN